MVDAKRLQASDAANILTGVMTGWSSAATRAVSCSSGLGQRFAADRSGFFM